MRPLSAAVLLSTQKVYKKITTHHVKWNIKGEQSATILRERELTCSLVVVIPTTNYFVAFVNMAEGVALAGHAYTILGVCALFLVMFFV